MCRPPFLTSPSARTCIPPGSDHIMSWSRLPIHPESGADPGTTRGPDEAGHGQRTAPRAGALARRGSIDVDNIDFPTWIPCSRL